MAEVNPITSVVSTPIQTPAQNSSNNNEVLQVVEDNSKTAKTCAYAALGASVASLLPMSVLAIRTGKISKAASSMGEAAASLEKKTTPILEDIQKMTSVPAGIAGTIKDTAGQVSVGVKALLGTLEATLKRTIEEGVNSEEAKKLLETIQQKIEKFDVEKFNEGMGSSFETLKAKLAEIDTSKLNEDVQKAINEVLAKIKDMKITQRAEGFAETVCEDAENVVSRAEASVEEAAEGAV